MARAAAGPWCSALSQCSTRSRPKPGWRWLATSPAAKMPGALVSSRPSTSTPFSTASPAASASPVRGAAPTPTTTTSQAIVAPSCGRDALDPAVALEGRHAGLHPQVDAVVAMQVAVDRADLVPEHALERHRLGRDDGDVQAALPGRGGDLRPDPAGADDDQPAARVEALAQRVAVGERPQQWTPVEVGAGEVQPPRLGAGGQQQPVVAEPLAAVQRELPGARVERRSPPSPTRSSMSWSA